MQISNNREGARRSENAEDMYFSRTKPGVSQGQLEELAMNTAERKALTFM